MSKCNCDFRPGPHGPIVVHGSTGVGRTGTFCAINICIDLWQNEQRLNVPGVLKHVRKMRHSSVTNYGQYKFIWTVLNAVISLSESNILVFT
uniref:AsIV-cont00002-ORF1 n=1 Tax=Apophua simplicipes ichnovirus TaxID=1329648 RepID=S5DSU4_9VIRU|nr:AsIV-cont00002-ORF1 [Apophua simplicipes ichnovirus]